jgi:hypothetical protein
MHDVVDLIVDETYQRLTVLPPPAQIGAEA